MKRFFGTVFAVFVSLVLFFVLLPILILPALISGEKRADLPRNIVLELDLRQHFSDQPHASPLDVLGAGTPSVVKVVEALARAESDSRVAGVFVRLDGGIGLPLAQAEEIRDSLRSMRAVGKYVVVHSQSFYSSGLGSYYAAAESDELWMQPNGSMATRDVKMSSLFARSVLDGMGAPTERVRSLEAPTATTTLNVDTLSAAHRESYASIVSSIYDRATRGIAESKNMTPEQVQALLQASPYLASEALAAGLVSHLGYDDEAEAAALTKAGENAALVDWTLYLKGAGTPYAEGEVIAVVYGEGPIGLGNGGQDIRSGTEPGMGGDITANAIRAAADDLKVKAILFRVESAGGSAVASDQIWDAVNYAKEQGKPVVVSMGSVAASGGYYVAMSADRIIAQPTTVTGSIGVAGGKFAMGGSYGVLGLAVEGPTGDEDGEPGQELSDPNLRNKEDWQAVQKMMGSIYTDFTSKVAAGRGMSVEAVHEIAQGRIWSGAQAKEIGLIDDLGGFRFAIGETKRMIGLEVNAAIELRTFPGPRTKLEQLADMLGVSASVVRVIMMFSQFGQVETVKDLAESIYLDSQPSELTMDPVEVE
jgi:protease IV